LALLVFGFSETQKTLGSHPNQSDNSRALKSQCV